MLLSLPIRKLSSRLGPSVRAFTQGQQRRNRSVLVTGGAMGLGEGICRRLAADGYSVTIADMNVEKGQAVAQELGGAFVEVDVSVPEQVEQAIQQVVDANGSLDALVNNAGVVGPQLTFSDYGVDEWKKVIDINLNGVFYGLKYGTAQMKQQKTGGSIVNMSSTAGFRGFINLGPYAASKFAVRGMTQAAAMEVAGQKIRVNALAPTGCDTPMVRAFINAAPDAEAMEAEFTSMNAIPGLPQPSDVAAACAFLLSDEARFITGHTLPVDAGAISKIGPEPADPRASSNHRVAF